MVGLLEKPAEHGEPTGPIADAKATPKRVKRVERPNKAALDEDVAIVFNEIDAIQTRIYEIKALIENKQQNKQVASAEFLDARNHLNDLSSSFRSVMDEKRGLRDELDHADKLRERMRADARSLRDKLPYVRVEQIDEEIKKLEYRMSHTSLTLQEEKKLLQQVKDLSKSRDFVKDYNDRLEQITQDEGSRAELLEKIREKDLILNSLRAQQEDVRRLLVEIKEKDASQTVDIPVLLEERNSAFEKIKMLREQVKELKVDFRAREEEYWERERQWKEQQAIQRRKDFEKRDADRKEREKIRKQRELENFVEPFTDEIIIVDQLTSYLQKFVPAVEEVAPIASQKAEIVVPKGVGNVLVSKKNKFDEETDSWFSGKCKGKKAKAPTAPKNKGKDKLSLSLDALTSFQKVRLSAPTTVGDVLRSIDELKVKRVEFLRRQNEAREKRERGEKSSLEEEPKVEESLEKEVAAVQADIEEREVGEVGKVRELDVLIGVNSDLKGEGELPENLEKKVLSGLENKFPEDLETKLSESSETKLPEDLDANLPEDLEIRLPQDLETKLPEDLEGKLEIEVDLN